MNATKYREPRTVVDLLAAMVGIDTVNGGLSGVRNAEEPLCEYLAFAAAAFGLTVRHLEVRGFGPGHGHNLLAVYEHDPAAPWVLFDSHLDTVSVAGMSVDPFKAEVRGGRLWGRGACDTKGSGAAMLWALREYAAGGGGRNNAAILYSVDEEFGMTGVRSFMANDYHNLGFSVPGIVVGEPTGLRVVAAHNGLCRFRVTTHGVAAHASNPEAGRSAISAMVKIVAGIESGYAANLRGEHPLSGRSRCTVNVIRGGSAGNIIPDRCEVEVDRRLVPGERVEDASAAFRDAVASIAQAHPEIEYDVQESFLIPPLADSSTSAIAGAVSAVLADNGLPSEHTGAAYATNGGFMSAGGIPTVVIGPGNVEQAHTKDEWIDIAELERAAVVYRGIMASPGIG